MALGLFRNSGRRPRRPHAEIWPDAPARLLHVVRRPTAAREFDTRRFLDCHKGTGSERREHVPQTRKPCHRLPRACRDFSGGCIMATQAPRTASTVPALAPEREVRWPHRTKAKLANGLELILVESHTIPKFHGELFFRSGNAAAADRAISLAEITAAMVRTGTAKSSSREIEERLRGLGADLSVSAGQDTSAISFAGLSDRAEPLLQLVNELAREASFPATEFERERRQKLEEVKLERTQPGFLAGERLRGVLFDKHPYSLVSPTEEQVAAYSVEQLQSLYRDFYTPENAILLLVGDFEPAKLRDAVEKVFGDWSGKKPIPLESPAPATPVGRRVYLVHVPGAVQTQILCGCHAITRKHPDWVELGLTNSLYGGAFNSRLVMNIREEKGYTYSPRSAVNP